ncbi:MAG: hypothetical protein Q9222_002554 [Ikaeria aurantiellina]
MVRYEYAPLDPHTKTTRLMSLLPGSFHEDINVSIKTMKFTKKEAPDYEALSYTWASTDDPSEIIVTDSTKASGAVFERRLAVTQNLAVALRYLRSKVATRDIWIDAVCVDQENLEERGHQVAMVGDIYRTATLVLIWLGPECQDSSLAMRALGSLSSSIEVDRQAQSIKPSTTSASNIKDWPTWQLDTAHDGQVQYSILKFLQRGWFHRLWIWQEVLLAERAEIRCGHKTLDWNDFRKAIMALRDKHLPSYMSHDDKIRYKQALYDMYSLVNSTAGKNTFFGWVATTKSCHYTDPRDIVYALLNLLHKADPVQGLRPNYTQAPCNVFKAVVLRCLDRKGLLDLLESCEINENQNPNKPSWVPDWSRPRASKYLFSSGASYGTKAEARYIDGGLLQVCCVFTGKVSGTEPLLGGGDVHRYFRFTPQSFLDLAHSLSHHIRHYRPHATEIEVINVLCRTLCTDIFRESYKPPFTYLPSLEESVTFIASLFHPCSGGLPEPPQGFLSQAADFGRGRCLVLVDNGLVGLAPETAKVGDRICVILGCDVPLLIRSNDMNGSYTVIGACFIYGLMASEALLGPLPTNLTGAMVDVERSGYIFVLVNSSNSEDHAYEDPRLEGQPLPEGWTLERPDEPQRSNWFVNDETGERLRWPHDPRMTPECLAARGVLLQEIILE